MSKPQPPAHGKSGVSRRAFLKGSGAAAAASALVGGTALAADEKKTTAIVGPGKKTITLNVNGKPRQVEVELRTTLLEALRNGLNLTGAKPISSTARAAAAR